MNLSENLGRNNVYKVRFDWDNRYDEFILFKSWISRAGSIFCCVVSCITVLCNVLLCCVMYCCVCNVLVGCVICYCVV